MHHNTGRQKSSPKEENVFSLGFQMFAGPEICMFKIVRILCPPTYIYDYFNTSFHPYRFTRAFTFTKAIKNGKYLYYHHTLTYWI